MSGRYAVVGHVEWVEFARVPRMPGAGEVVHASETWQDAGGGGSVAAVQLARLAGGADFFTALGADDGARRARERLEAHGVRVHGAPRPGAQRRCFTHIDGRGERTITVLGERLMPHGEDDLPWELLEEADAVYFTLGDEGALRHARRGRVLVAAPRARDTLAAAGVRLDALVRSGGDPGELLDAAALDPPPALTVTTSGSRGGTWETPAGERGTYAAAPLPGAARDAYGPGDCFAAALTYGLGAGLGRDGALALAARAGAHKRAGRAPLDGMLTDA